MGRFLVVVSGLMSVAVLMAGAQAPSQPPEAPQFRVGVDAIRLDVVVTDRDGNIVSDLALDDFEVRQDGKVQPLTLAQYVPVEVTPQPRLASKGPATPTTADRKSVV